MAEIVFAFGSVHGPMMVVPPEEWHRLGERDQRDPRFSFETLRKGETRDLADELTPERKRQRFDAVQAAVERLAGELAKAAPDVILVVSNPHRVFPDDQQTVFGVYTGASMPFAGSELDRIVDPGRDATERAPRDVVQEKPAHPELAGHLLSGLVDEGFDIAWFDRFREGAVLEHAYTVLYERYLRDADTPMVPFILSRYLPHQGTPARCFALGEAMHRVIDAWDSDARVAIMASGGLSHQIVDEELDRRALDALQRKDKGVLTSLSRERLNRAPGTPETLNWVTVCAAVPHLEMTPVDYVPAYRSLAGTGHGMGFVYWR